MLWISMYLCLFFEHLGSMIAKKIFFRYTLFFSSSRTLFLIFIYPPLARYNGDMDIYYYCVAEIKINNINNLYTSLNETLLDGYSY